MTPSDCRIQLVLGIGDCVLPAIETVSQAIEEGVDLLQLREKAVPTEERVRRGRDLTALAQRAGVPILVNDDVEAAAQLGADGVHLGLEDEDPRLARERLGTEAWIGRSTHSRGELEALRTLPVTHAGLGCCRPTATKHDTHALADRELEDALRHASLPVFAIGGISPETLPELLELGVRRIAVSSCVSSSERPAKVVRALRRLLDEVL